jgi:hypothetical protein
MVAWSVRVNAVLAAASLFSAGLPLAAADAAWSADTYKDASGRLKVELTAEVDGTRSIYATCDTSRNAVLALLVPATEPTLSITGMTLSFAFAGGSRFTSRADLYRYDNDLVAVGYGNAADVPAIMSAFAGAREAVQIGLGAPAGGQTWSADVRGSSAAVRKFLDNCFPTN